MIRSAIGSKNIALTVKSRRSASSSAVPNSLSRVISRSSSSLSPAPDAGAVRKVATSRIFRFWLKWRCASLKRRPMIRQLRGNVRLTWAGRAAVAMS
jgi:hypothetical protein